MLSEHKELDMRTYLVELVDGKIVVVKAQGVVEIPSVISSYMMRDVKMRDSFDIQFVMYNIKYEKEVRKILFGKEYITTKQWDEKTIVAQFKATDWRYFVEVENV